MEQKGLEFISYKKVAIFGYPGVGKSSLVTKMEMNTFSEEYTPTEQINH